MKIHKRYRVISGASGKAKVIDIFVGLPVVSKGRPMVDLHPEEARAIADLFNAIDEERLGKSRRAQKTR